MEEKKSNVVAILVHGYWHAAWFYALLKMLLEKYGILVITVDLHPDKSKNLPRYKRRWHGIGTCISQIKSTINKVHAENPEKELWLIAHSLGGLGSMFAMNEAEVAKKVKRLVLLSSVPYYGAWGATINFATNFFGRFLKFLLLWNPVYAIDNIEVVRTCLFTPETDEKIVQDCFKKLRNDSFWVYVGMLLYLPLFFARKVRKNIKDNGVDIVGIGGTKDFLVKDVEKTAKWLSSSAEVHVIKGAPHNFILIPAYLKKVEDILFSNI